MPYVDLSEYIRTYLAETNGLEKAFVDLERGGLFAPGVPICALQTGGACDPGEHLVAVCYVNGAGSGPIGGSAVVVTTGLLKTIRVTRPSRVPEATHWGVYLSPAGETALFWVADVGIAIGTYDISVADVGLTVALVDDGSGIALEPTIYEDGPPERRASTHETEMGLVIQDFGAVEADRVLRMEIEFMTEETLRGWRGKFEERGKEWKLHYGPTAQDFRVAFKGLRMVEQLRGLMAYKVAMEFNVLDVL